MKMLRAIKTWFKNYFRVKCNYCNKKTDVWYEAYMFPVKEYKGQVMCPNCVDKTCKDASVKLHKVKL